MKTMQMSEENVEFLEHYGVKGMRWGVRRYKSRASRAGAATRKVGEALLVGDPKTSLVTKRGRKNFKKNVSADIKKAKKITRKILDNKAFKTLIYDDKEFKKQVKLSKQRNKQKVDRILALTKKKS